ncbi:hypothetical protein GCM10010932_32640 [Agromyces flavus]|nr:hypothetical protein GCM10010932_32640 [Agromyces flavus]
MLPLPCDAAWIGNSAEPPGKASVAVSGRSAPAASFTTLLTASPVIVTWSPALRPGVGRRARPEYSLDVPTAHCRIRQQMAEAIGGCHSTAVARRRAAAEAMRSSGAVSERRMCCGKWVP